MLKNQDILEEFHEKFGEWLEMTTHQDLLLIQLMADEIVRLRSEIEYYQKTRR
jgi:hypothetical protein